MDQELIDALTHQHIGLDEPNIERALAEAEPIQVADLREEALRTSTRSPCAPVFRARLVAPLLHGKMSSACWWSAAARLAPSRRTLST